MKTTINRQGGISKNKGTASANIKGTDMFCGVVSTIDYRDTRMLM